MDSAHSRPLVGARVLAFGIEPRPDVTAGATTDARGRYRIDSLPPGRYMIGFESPLLDSLEITLAPHEVVIATGRTASANLAFPSGTTLRSAACPGASLPKETGAILGRIVDPDTERPLAGVVIATSWQELAIDRTTLRSASRDRNGAATTDDRGWYRLCGVPTDTWLMLQLQHRGRAGEPIRLLVSDSVGITLRHLSFSAASSRPLTDIGAAGDGVDTTPMSGTALLNGVVRGLGDAPLANADLRVRGSGSVGRSDASGRYSLTELPVGTQVLEVRHVGYLLAQEPVELRSGRAVTRDVRLRRIVSLDSVRVVAQRSRYREFEEHRKQGFGGTFISIDQIERRRATYASDLLQALPGFRLVGDGINTQVTSGRGVSINGVCKVNVVIDGIHWQDINLVSVGDIGAIEAYRQGQPAPMTYDHGCGAIVIWTKR